MNEKIVEKRYHMAKKKSKQNKIIIQRIGMVLIILLLAISAIFLGMLLRVNVLPPKYLTIVLLVYLPIVILLLLFMAFTNIKVKIKIGAEVISTILIIFTGFISFYLYKTIDFMGNIKAKDYQVENYYIVVLNDSSYQNLEQLKNQKIGIHMSNLESQKDAVTLLNKKISYKKEEYNDFMELGEDLLDKKVDALYMNGSYLSMLQDENEKFDQNVKLLETIEIQVKNETVKKDTDVTKDAFNIYISGIDIYGNISSVSRSDVNIIVTINPVTHKILLTSIPRDYYVQLHGTTGYRDKLTHAGIYGVDMSVTTLEDLLDIDINYYARVNFTTLIELVDAVGGVTVNSDYNFTAISGERFVKGENFLNGTKALAFARERHAFVDGDRQRGKNQQKIITAILNKALSSKTLITKYTNILSSLQNSFQTNMDSNKIYNLVNMQLDQMPSWDIESINLDGSGRSEYTYSYSGQRLYVMEPDISSVNSAKEKIKGIMQGQ